MQYRLNLAGTPYPYVRIIIATMADLIIATNGEITRDDAEEEEEAGTADNLFAATNKYSYSDNDDDNKEVEATELRRKVLESPCMFASIAQFLPVKNVVSVAQTSQSMRCAVLQLNSHWSCDTCKQPVFRGSGMPNSCEDKCREKMCPSCTYICEFCEEIKCFECELFICASCDELVCADCECATSCSCDHGEIYCPSCVETCKDCNHPVTCEFCEKTLCCCEVMSCTCCGDYQVCFECKRTCSSCIRAQFVCPGCSFECPQCNGVHCMYCFLMGS